MQSCQGPTRCNPDPDPDPDQDQDQDQDQELSNFYSVFAHFVMDCCAIASINE